MNEKDLFRLFLIEYVDYMRQGRKVPDSALDELIQLTDDFVKDVDPWRYFHEEQLYDYLDNLKRKLSPETRAFFNLKYNPYSYSHCVGYYLNMLICCPDNAMKLSRYYADKVRSLKLKESEQNPRRPSVKFVVDA